MKGRLLIAAVACCLLAHPSTGPTATTEGRRYDLMLMQFKLSMFADEGRYAEALPTAFQMLATASGCRDTVWMIESHQAIALLLARSGRADSARWHAAAALDLSNTPAGRSLTGSSLWILADAIGARGHSDSVLIVLQAAASTGLAMADSVDAGIALLDMGQRLLWLGHPEAALARLDSATALLATSHEPGPQSAAHAGRARCMHRLKQFERACAEFEVAYRLLTESRSLKFSDDARLVVMDRARGDFFTEWQDAWLSRGDTPSFHYRAIGVAERGRAQALLDLVQPADTMVSDTSGLLHTVPTPGRRFGPGRDLADDAVQALIDAAPPGHAVVYYSQTPDSLLIWIFKAGVLTRAKTFFPARLFERMRPFVSAISDTALAPAGASGWWFRYMASTGGPQAMYAQIAEACFPDTLLSVIKDARELLIVPDGWLKQVPFAALPVAGKPLGLRVAIRYAPSLATLENIEGRTRPAKPFEPAEIMVLGDPASCLPRLAGARAEADSVAAMLGVRPLLGAAATESTVTAAWPRLRVLHVAAHGNGFAEPWRARQSSVCLVPTSGFDGRLTADEIQHMPNHSNLHLVFLSACKTGFGASTQADATVGLPRACLANGARTVVASMWRLDDGSTEYLVRRFYRHLLRDADRPSITRAMHLAMVETSRRRPEWKDPKYWAAFQVIGVGD